MLSTFIKFHLFLTPGRIIPEKIQHNDDRTPRFGKDDTEIMTRNTGIWTGTAAVIAIATAVFTVVYTMPMDLLPVQIQKAPEQHAHAVESPSALCEEAEKAAAPAYLVKLDGDMLCVFAEGSRTPAAEYELPAGWLPDYDRILLEYGIRVRDTEELRQILEDYVS